MSSPVAILDISRGSETNHVFQQFEFHNRKLQLQPLSNVAKQERAAIRTRYIDQHYFTVNTAVTYTRPLALTLVKVLIKRGGREFEEG